MTKRILLVDDEQDILDNLGEALRKASYNVTTALNGKEALEILQKQDSDLLITDLKMPQMDGESLLAEASKSKPDMEIMIISACGDMDTVIRCLKEEKAYDFLKKPFGHKDVLLNSVKRVLKHGEMKKNIQEFPQRIATALGIATDSKDPYTKNHSGNVADLAMCIGREYGVKDIEIETAGMKLKDLEISGWLHDLGKIGISDTILNKPSSLTKAEFAAIKMHPQLGHEIIAGTKLSSSILEDVHQHHEAFDGSGYPQGLAGDKIHLFGRILAVADSYDTMVSERAYKKNKMTPEEALHELKYGYSSFRKDEFKDSSTIEKLCKAIVADNYAVSIDAPINTINGLNELLKSSDFFGTLRSNKPALEFSNDIIDLANKTSCYKGRKFSGLNKYEQNTIIRLNRLLLEKTYPQEAPVSPKNNPKYDPKVVEAFEKYLISAKLISSAT